jgi:DNA sulfur modification protein DndC
MELFQQIKEEMKKVYLTDNKPICIAWSGGKDSSLLLTLSWEMLLELPPEKRTKTIHVINSDTLVETPAMSDYTNRTLDRIEREAAIQGGGLPIKVHRVRPKMKDRFFYRVLGRGNLIATPKTKHRGCTHWLKITPMQETLKELIASAPVQLGEDKTVLTLWLGVRVEESARRAASISAFQLSEQSLFARHSDFDEILCFHPLKYVDTDSLWFYLLDKGTLPYGVTVNELTIQYGEGILECGIKTSKDQGQSCGGGRLGCWTCGMSGLKDPMLLRYIAEGMAYEGMLAWKNLMLSMRNDIRYREIFPRQDYNRYFKSVKTADQIDLFDTDETTKNANRFDTYRRAIYEEYAPGGLSYYGRRKLLEYLLYIQERDGHHLISEEEIEAILGAWKDTEGITISRSEIQPKDFKYDGALVFLPDKTVNKKETKTQNPVFYVTIELNKEETELYRFLKERQKVTETNLFFFPDSVEFKDKKLVWNKVTFVLCGDGIDTQGKANEQCYKWLGWEFGKFTKETKAAAINFLILSALSEGLSDINKRSKIVEPYNPLPVTHTEDGQLAFAI